MSSNFDAIQIHEDNVNWLKEFGSSHFLLSDILVGSDSINKSNFLKFCLVHFILDVDTLFNFENSKNKENDSRIKLPILDTYLPKTLIPNIFVTLLIVQFFRLYITSLNLKIIISGSKSQNKDLCQELIPIYQKYNVPKLNHLNIYNILLYIITAIFILIVIISGDLFYKPDYPTDDFYVKAHNFYGFLNMVALTVIGFVLIPTMLTLIRLIKICTQQSLPKNAS
jgi:hypothetical protein